MAARFVRSTLKLALAATLGGAIAACNPPDAGTAGDAGIADDASPQPTLAVMTSLPIIWAEGDVGAMLSDDTSESWVRAALDERFRLEPLDRLTQLGGQDFLLLAQPRALAGDENVALDEWVRGGGRVLLLADPLLTAHSRYALGDARAPQPVALLSPILDRWGLELRFDPAQSPDEAQTGGPLAIPVRMSGTLHRTERGFESDCNISENALVADCAIGSGRALVVADAALIEDGDHPSDSAQSAFARLVKSAFGVGTGPA